MADYKRMYMLLAKEADRALTELENGAAGAARAILQKALLDAEELYVSAETPVVELKIRQKER